MADDRRNELYANDPVYRAKRLLENRRHQKAKQTAAKREKLKARYGALVDYFSADGVADIESRGLRTVRGEDENGVQKTYFTLLALSKVLGKSVSTLRTWEANGVLPEAKKNQDGIRVYTLEQVEELRATLLQQGKISSVGHQRLPTNRTYTRMIEFAGGRREQHLLYPIGTLCKMMDRSKGWVDSLHRKGYLPVTPFRTASSLNSRLYTGPMLLAIRTVLERNGHPTLTVRGMDPKGVFAAIEAEWKRLGVMDAVLVEDTDESQKSKSGTRARAARRIRRNLGSNGSGGGTTS